MSLPRIFLSPDQGLFHYKEDHKEMESTHELNVNDQPKLALSRLSKFRTYVGIRKGRRRRLGQAKHHTNHEADLLLCRAAASDDGLFHAARGVFENGQPALCGSKNRGTTRGPEFTW